ncbi:MAG: hypothetical protein ABWW70_05960 [Thermoproteota archaeon]
MADASKLCKLLEEIRSRLSQGSARLLARGLEEAVSRDGDVSALCHWASAL